MNDWLAKLWELGFELAERRRGRCVGALPAVDDDSRVRFDVRQLFPVLGLML